MKITANEIARWSTTAEAQGDLPRLVRNLIHTTGTVTKISVPAGDSTVQPGFDGELFSPKGSAWVPADLSVWEMSCQADVGTKATADYKKRVEQFSAGERAERTYVAVSGRKWNGKSRWQREKTRSGEWRDVRAYDACDLEEWLEQSPGVALSFAEQLGLTGPGVESLSAYWRKWSAQCAPPITIGAISAGREDVTKSILEQLHRYAASGSSELLALKADSVEEAAAFTCACLLEDPILSVSTVVVTEKGGWRFIDANTQITIAIAARPELADTPSSRTGLTVVIPYASGDMSGHFQGAAGKADDSITRIERPDHSDFDKALVDLGIDENDARRLSSLCGRSWTVFRRSHAVNPSIRRPGWLESNASRALSTVCLISGWSTRQSEDRRIIESVSGRSYSDLERDLIELEQLDDSPVMRIGQLWKAKSPMELLSLFGERIPQDELDRFFECAENVLSTPDPQLELPDEERHAAAIHGKTRPTSGFLVEALADTIIKLAVRGPDVPALQAKKIEQRVSALVSRLLEDADSIRWLSLSRTLPMLAEAAPSAFLRSVERSLERPDAPVRSLIEETRGSGLFGQCWHSGLLWALETLAWAPERLARVCMILAALTETPVKGNWANTPANTLVDIFRSWFPQTAANIDQRIDVLDILIARVPDAAYALLDRLAHVGHDVAMHTHRPRWRDDDAGAGQGATNHEMHSMLVAAADRQIVLACGRPDRIAKLISKLADFDDERARNVFNLIDELSGPETSDEDKEIVRNELRQKIHWHRNYDDTQGTQLDSRLAPYETAYEALTPNDVIIRNSWLFADSWVQLPIRTRDDEDFGGLRDAAAQWRTKALQEIYDRNGWDGLVKLSEHSNAGRQVGWVLPSLTLTDDAIAEWITISEGEFLPDDPRTAIINGYLHAIGCEKAVTIIKRIFAQCDTGRWSTTLKVHLLILAPECPAIWHLAQTLGDKADNEYWQKCMGSIWPRDHRGELLTALENLLKAKRPRTALHAAHLAFKEIGGGLLASILEGILRGDESEAPLPQSYSIREAISRLEASDDVEKERTARIEFGFIRALKFGGEKEAVTLFQSVMSDAGVFVELLSLAYKPRNRTQDIELSEGERVAAENAWHVLHDCSVQPGTDARGYVDNTAFAAFVDKARDLAAKADRLSVCDIVLGEIIARGPVGNDGAFPFEPARPVLDRPELEDVRRGFHTGCFNKRGVVSRGMHEGGRKERELAAYYHQQAEAIRQKFPYAAQELDALSQAYKNDGLRVDLDARLRREER